MKTKQRLMAYATAGVFLASALCVRAGTIINNFDVPFDYVANGIIGNTTWDGVYLGFGDVPGGTGTGTGIGATVQANTTFFGSGFLVIQSRGTDWSGAADDGFFLYKVVQGDFDVSVKSVPGTLSGGTGFDNRANNFVGLMVRAYNTNNSGAPYSPGRTNVTENFLNLWRFNEFSLDGEIRQSTNGANIENTFPSPANTFFNTDTNTTRFYRITRAGDTFSFYIKTNEFDDWFAITNAATGGAYTKTNGTVTRPDLHGVALQVGIAQGAFSTAARDAVFSSFQLTGTNVTVPVMPPAPSSVVFSGVNNNSVNISWTTNGGDGSLVVIRANAAIIANPVQGITYAADPSFKSTTNLVDAGGEHAVYLGAGTNVTVTGLGGSNNLYQVAVYSYSGSGSGPVYNTASPATGSTNGPGRVAQVSFTVVPTTLPVGGAGLAQVQATYDSGDSYDVSSDPNVTLNSSDTSILLISSGAMNGVSTGTVAVIAGYANVLSTNNVTVTFPRFTDDFSASQDYVANGVMGTPYDRLYLNFGDTPSGNALGTVAGDVQGATISLNANSTSNNILSLNASGGTWETTGDDGPFLARIVTGDFEASVHVNSMDQLNFNCAGLMARLYGTGGAPGGAGTRETHVNLWRVQNGTPAARLTIDNGGFTARPGVANDRWLLLARVNSTNFYTFEKANPTDPWTPIPGGPLVMPEAANNVAMEIGIAQQMQNAGAGVDFFDSLMVDGPGLSFASPPPPATNMGVTLNNDLTMTFTWVAASVSNTPIRSMLVMRAGGPITAQPDVAQAGAIGATATTVTFGTGVNIGDGNWIVFGSANPPPSINNSVVVNGLVPGVTYYAAVYTFTGSGAGKQINPILPPNGAATNLVDGNLLFVEVLPPPTIPMGGLIIPQVIGHYQGGGLANVSQFATITPTDQTVVQTANGALSGMTNGSTSVQIIYKGFTNNVTVTVRPPTFTDEFNASHDYLNGGVAGSAWDGVYQNQGDIPQTTYVGTEIMLGAEANIGSPNTLSVTNQNGGFAGAQNNGFFLFKYVPADFQTAVHIKDYRITAFNEVGLMARGFSFGTNGTAIGAPFDLGLPTPANAESWMGFTKFDEFNIGTYARRNLHNVEEQFFAANQNSPDNWLLMIRQGGTQFTFYERATNNAPWRLMPTKTTLSAPIFAGTPMQVGIQQTPYTAGPVDGLGIWGHYEHFMLDVGQPSLTVATNTAGQLTLQWPYAPGYTLQQTPKLAPANWQPVPGTPANSGPGVQILTVLENQPAMFFRLIK